MVRFLTKRPFQCAITKNQLNKYILPEKEVLEFNEPKIKPKKKFEDELSMKDFLESQKLYRSFLSRSPQWNKLDAEWRNNLIRKQKSRERKQERDAQRSPMPSQEEKLVLH